MKYDLTFIEPLGNTRKCENAGTHHHIPVKYPLGRTLNRLFRVRNEAHGVCLIVVNGLRNAGERTNFFQRTPSL